MNSLEVSNAYYDRLGRDGLAAQTDGERTDSEFRFILERLSRGDRILDVACGYGRIARPLAEQGFSVTGVDASERMIADARTYAPGARFVQADMRELPFDDGAFSVIVCLWSSFNSMLTRTDQAAALAEFHRVLSPGGWVLIDVPDGDRERWDVRQRGHGPDGHLITDYFVGNGNTIYLHDEQTMTALCEASAFSFTISKRSFGGRQRMLVELRKE